MFKFKQIGILPVLILLITFVSTNPWSTKPVGNTTMVWVLCFVTMFFILRYKYLYFSPSNTGDYRIIQVYFIWMIIGVIRGFFVADNYWEWKQLIEGAIALSIPIFAYCFSIPEVTRRTLYLWVRVALPAFCLFFVFTMSRDAYQHYLSPVLFLVCFLPILPKKWKIILLAFTFLMMVADLGARSQVIKAVLSLLIGAAFVLSKYIPRRALYAVHWLCYIVPVILLALGITGIFNPYQAFNENAEGKYTTANEFNPEEDLSTDTRTFIYEEVLISADKHNYILQGRTPARGNDSWYFGAYSAEELKTGKYERHSNELCHLNLFTWLGLVGLILYSFIYLKSSYLALYRSNSTWLKLMGVFIAFRWAYGWVEDVNLFNILNVSLWMMIAMGFSEDFRQMDDEQIKNWVIKTLDG